MSGLTEVASPRSDSHDSHGGCSGFQGDQIGSSGYEERKLSETVVQFMKTVKDIDDVLDTWMDGSCNKIFVKMNNKEIACLQNLEVSVLDEVLLDMDNKKLTSFSNYISTDSLPKERLVMFMLSSQMHRPLRGAGTNDELEQELPNNAHVSQSKTTDDLNVPAPNQAFNLIPTNTGIKVEDKVKPPSMFGFFKWRRSSESTLSTGNTLRQRPLEAPNCSSNIMNYTHRRNSDTSLKGQDLSKLRRLENMRNRNSPTGSTSEIAQLFKKLTRQVSEPGGLKRNNSQDSCSLTDSSSKDDHSTSNSRINMDNVKEFAEADVETDQDGANAKDCKTMYSSAPNISSIGMVENENLSISEYDLATNVEVGPARPGMFRSGSLKVLNFFRNILPGEKPCTTEPLSLPRRFSMDSQLTLNRIRMFERDNITLSKRTIKLNRPDNSHAMYISAADTLGGLPEDEEINFPPRHARAQMNSLDEDIQNYLTTGRRASCPVILETEESDDHVGSRKFRLLSLKPKTRDFLSENSETGESGETIHSLDETGKRPSPRYKSMGSSDKCEHDIADSDQSSGGYSEVEESAAHTLLGGVTFIVDKRLRLKERQSAESFRENKHSTSDRVSDDRDSPNSTSHEDKTSSNDKLKKRPNKVVKKKKKKKNTKQRGANTHTADIGDAHTAKAFKVKRFSINNATDKTSMNLSDQSNNNVTAGKGIQVELTVNDQNHNSLVWNESSIRISSMARENESSSYFSDISCTDA